MSEAWALDVVPDAGLRAGAEEVCLQLCAVVGGEFGFKVETRSRDVTAQKLAMLSNVVLDAAHRAVSDARARAAELRDTHRIARIGTWRRDLKGDGGLFMSNELHAVLGTDPDTFEQTPAAMLAVVHPDDRATTATALARAAAGEALEHRCRVARPDGTFALLWVETRPEWDHEGRVTAVRGVCQDVTERHAAAERIYQLAHHDALTGLANRVLLHERLAGAVAQAQCGGGGHEFAVLCLDLDGFKAVNDLHGHATGDALLQEVAARLCRSVRDGDTVARLGGDEFVVLQVGQRQPHAARTLAARLAAALSNPYDLAPDIQVALSTSIGVAQFPGHGDDPAALLRNADTALYRAKAAGKDAVAFFQPAMDRELRERRAMERDLRQAIARNEFTLDWQPLAAAGGDGAVTGFEVLLRWRHPERGMVAPDVFIPLAETSGAIVPLGAWVVQQACHEAARWPVPLRVAVNVSPVQAQGGDGFAAMVERALLSSGLHPSRLVLEVTEGFLIRDPARVLAGMRRLKALGVQVALDDFGTGYSSLATLRSFPFDSIKIDRSFIAGIGDGGPDAAIVRGVLGLARGLGLPVVAEGVETEAQLDALRRQECEEVQGWLIGRPAPIATFANLTGVPG